MASFNMGYLANMFDVVVPSGNSVKVEAAENGLITAASTRGPYGWGLPNGSHFQLSVWQFINCGVLNKSPPVARLRS